MHVLLVDDSDTSELIVRSLLPESSYRVERVAGLRAARAAIARAEHDVALVDYKLPGYTGIELIREAVKAGCPMPLILLTGYGEESVDLEAMAAGATDYLDKGNLDAVILDRTLRYAVERRRSGDAVLRLRKAVETMQIGVTITDLNGRIVYVNRAEADMHGYTAEELVAREVRLLSPAEDRRPFSVQDLRHARQWRRERTRIRKDGSVFPVHLLSDVVCDELGNPIGLVTTCEDISERRAAEEALRASESRYRSLVESARDVIFTVGLGGTFVSLNPAFEKLTGWPRDRWLHEPLDGLAHPEDLGAVHDDLAAVARGETVPLRERRVLSAAGEWLTVEVTSTPLVEGGKVAGVLGIARDVTPRKRAEQRQDVQLAVTRVMAESSTLDEAAPQLLRAIGERLAFHVGLLWVVDPERPGLRCLCLWNQDGVKTGTLESSLQQRAFPSPSNLVNWVWASGQPAWVRDVAREPGPVPYAAAADGLHGAFGTPILAGAEKVGVLEFYARTSRPPDHGALVTMQDIGRQMGMFVERDRAQARLRESEQRFRSVAQSAQDAIVLADHAGRIVFWNQAAARLFGWESDEVLGRQLSSLVAPRHRPDLEAALEGLRRGVPAPLLGAVDDFVAQGRGGNGFPAEVSLSTWSSGGELSFAAILRDITDRRRSEEALRESAERYALAVRGTNDGIWDWDLKADRMYLSPRWKQILGYGDAELGDAPQEWLDRVHPDDAQRVLRKIAVHVAGDTPLFEDEHRVRHKDGTYRWVLCRGFAVHDPDGLPHRMAGAQTDVTDRRAYDPLTGLPNRVLFVERLVQAVERSRAQGDALFAVLFLDLDGFKAVNDTLGHLAGDQLLMATARRLEASVRPGDVVARFGGDEFAVLLQRIGGTADATRVAGRILANLAEALEIDHQPVTVRASIGIAFNHPDVEGPDVMMREADAAMYRAKALGKGRYEVFDDAMRARESSRLEMQRDLRVALGRGELSFVWQPALSLAEPRVLGFEALLRWQHPEHGTLLPADFLELAEEANVTASWRAWALRTALGHLAGLDARVPGQPWLALNLSTRQLQEPGLAAEVAAALEHAGIAPGRLRLEATEATLHAAEVARGELEELRRRGVKVLVDDFGRDEASLRWLLELPVDGLKLDGSLLSDVEDPARLRLLRSAMAIGAAVGLEMTAEAVETEPQRTLLLSVGCLAGQGTLLAPVMSSEELENFLAASPA